MKYMENEQDFVQTDVNVTKLSIGGLMQKKWIPPKKKKIKGVYTPAQELAVELANYYGEPKRVGFWLGIIKRYGIETVRVQWKGMADSRDPKGVGLLLFMLKKKKAEYEKRNTSVSDGKVQGAKNKPSTE